MPWIVSWALVCGALWLPRLVAFQRPEEQLAEWAFNEWVLKIFISQNPDRAKEKQPRGVLNG